MNRQATCLLLCSLLFFRSALALEPPKGIRHFDAGHAADFTLPDLDGEMFTLGESRGRWVFLHFWASWCGPCREEMPTIQQLADNPDAAQITFVMVNTAEDEDTVFRFLAEIGMEMPSLLDRDGLVTEQYRPRGLPTTILVDPAGRIRYQAIGGREWNQPVYSDFLKALTKG